MLTKRRKIEATPLRTGVSQKQNDGESAFQFVDNRPEAIAQRKIREMASDSSQVRQLRAIQEMPADRDRLRRQIRVGPDRPGERGRSRRAARATSCAGTARRCWQHRSADRSIQIASRSDPTCGEAPFGRLRTIL